MVSSGLTVHKRCKVVAMESQMQLVIQAELFVSAKSLSLTFIISAYLDSFRGWNFLSIYDANMNQ